MQALWMKLYNFISGVEFLGLLFLGFRPSSIGFNCVVSSKVFSLFLMSYIKNLKFLVIYVVSLIGIGFG